jgi:hypothetical protein
MILNLLRSVTSAVVLRARNLSLIAADQRLVGSLLGSWPVVSALAG